MEIHVKTTLEIDEGVMRDLKARAARDGKTMSELVEAALRALLEEKPAAYELPPMPTFDSGGFLMNIDSRAEYLDAMDDELEGDDVPR
jgi:plasmid stability protein